MMSKSNICNRLRWIGNSLAQVFTAIVILNILIYFTWGVSSQGHTYYYDVSKSTHFGAKDYKGWMPLHTLTIPLLGAATAVNLIWANRDDTNNYRRPCLRMPALLKAVSSRLSHFSFRVLHWFRLHVDRYDLVSILLVFLPLSSYLYFDISRHMEPDMSTDKKVKEISKAFGMTSMMSLSTFFLIPVTRHGILTHSHPSENTVRVHIWSGSIAIFAAVIHGVTFVYRWAYLKNPEASVVTEELFPEVECWTSYEQYTSNDCQDVFQNLTGLIAAICIVMLGFMSINWIRRLNYSLFYKVHVLLGPIALLFMIMHVKRMVLYLSPSLLYYVAGNVPVWLNMLWHWRCGGVTITSVTDLSSESSRGLVALTFPMDGATSSIFRPGMSVKLSFPGASVLSHPFTVNLIQTSTGSTEGLVIFRTTGHFTRSLAERALVESQQRTDEEESYGNRVTKVSSPFTVLVDGFYGNERMLHNVLCHQSVLIVAGGVGIAPYLSLLPELVMKCPRIHVHLHWICRNTKLIDYVKQMYISRLENICSNDGREGGMIHITLHCTSQSEAQQPLILTHVLTGQTELPYSAYSLIRHQSSIRNNLFTSMNFSLLAFSSLFIIWYFYLFGIHNDLPLHARLYGILTLVPSTILIGSFNMIVAHKIVNSIGLVKYSRVVGNASENLDDSNTIDSGVSLSDLNKAQNEQLSEETEVNDRSVKVEYFIRGRPDAHSIVVDFLTGSHVDEKRGIFACGPNLLLQDIRAAVAEQKWMHISLYEEIFEL